MRSHAFVLLATLLVQSAWRSAASAQSFIDPVNGRTLEQLIASALQQSPEILAARAAIDVAGAQLQQAGSRPNPTLTGGYRQAPAGSDNQTSVMMQVPLDLFRREGRAKAASANVIVAELSAADKARLLAANVREQAGVVLFASRLLVVTDQLLDVNRRTRDLLAARVNEGASPPIDRDIADVEVRRLEAERAQRLAELDTAMLQLKALLGLAPDAPLTLADDLGQQVRKESALAGNADVTASGQQRADVREAGARIEAAQAREEQLRREARFDVSLYGSYMRMDTSFPQRGVSANGALEPVRGIFHYAEVGAMVMLPIFNQNQGAIASAASERRMAEFARQSREISARSEVEAAVVHQRHAAEAIDRYAAARELARRNVDVIRESYQLGRNTLFEVFTEQRRLLEVETAYAEALARAFAARTAFIRATGVLP